jgi:hypothetical protein
MKIRSVLSLMSCIAS